MNMNLLTVSSKEQTIILSEGYSAEIKFDKIYKRWFFDLYKDGDILYAGITLTPSSIGLNYFNNYSLGIVDYLPKDTDYEPFVELGQKLGLLELYNEDNE